MSRPGTPHPTQLLTVLDDARWAPSGDNTQPWRFELTGERSVVVHGRDTRDHVVYDLRGEASQLSLGALLETLAVSGTRFGWQMSARRRPESAETRPTFDVHFEPRGLPVSPVLDFVRRRAVQRRPMSTRPLTEPERQALSKAAGSGFSLRWFEGRSARWRVARMLFDNAHLRLTLPEAYRVHRDVIEWGARESVDRVPALALGVDRMNLAVMKFAMASWERVHFANRFLAGTWLPRLQMDLLPAMACAAHAVILSDRPSAGIDDQVAAGRAVQRLWLEATRLGLWQQPEMTPLIFSRYARQGQRFAADDKLQSRGALIARQLEGLLGPDAERAVWMGRLGEGPAPMARSVRKPLKELLVDSDSSAAVKA